MDRLMKRMRLLALLPLLALLSPPLSHASTGTSARPGARTATTGGTGVVANLWEWNWPSVAHECTSVLGPAGYAAVQVAPPQDSYASPGREWWDVYQPVDYNLTSRMGNDSQFKAMVAACRAAGVKVYVDAVINHMTNESAVSYGGVSFSKYNYPGLYTDKDFHHYPADCPESDGTIHNFADYTEVTKCELGGLADLRTESDSVRDTLAAYLNTLLSDGVSGFRIDSAKHIRATDLAAIESRLHMTADGTPPYIALEVVPNPGAPADVNPVGFESVGSLLNFDYAGELTHAFVTNIAGLRSLDEQHGYLPSDKSLVFVENHDTERSSAGLPVTLNYKSGRLNVLATIFMLAWNYGTPEVYASFSWDDGNQPPPSDARGFVTNTDCSHGWVCVDRNARVVRMVAWHNKVGDAPVTHWYSDKHNLIAFSRGSAGWIAINNERKAEIRTFSTGLAPGRYCDLMHGAYKGGTCSGPLLKVNARGQVRVILKTRDAVAIDTASVVK
jgi:alpha-amylase